MMQFPHRFLLLAILLALAPVSAATAGEVDSDFPIFDRPICEPPISVCNTQPLGDNTLSTVFPDRECPAGFACTCVPSCPECDDCAAEVCLRDRAAQCETACDCPVGLGCFDGQCIAGFAPVFCCESPFCPYGQQCQSRDGSMNRCEMPGDPSCQERREKVANAIEGVIERYSACREDSDCVRIDTSTQCMGTCGDFVNGDHAPVVERIIDKFDLRVCTGYRKAGCPFATPACILQEPKCIDNLCTGVPFEGFPIGPFVELEPDRGVVLKTVIP